jgi:hypothetical protein
MQGFCAAATGLGVPCDVFATALSEGWHVSQKITYAEQRFSCIPFSIGIAHL